MANKKISDRLDEVSKQASTWLDSPKNKRKAIDAIKRWEEMPLEDVLMELALGANYLSIRSEREKNATK